MIPPVKFRVRIAVIVTKAMRSDPDVQLLAMTERKRLDWEVTDLPSSVSVSIISGTERFQPHAFSGQFSEIK